MFDSLIRRHFRIHPQSEPAPSFRWRTARFVFFCVGLLTSVAFCDWSVPVLLWEDQPGGFDLAPVDAAIAVDAQENVHIVFTRLFANPRYPQGPAFTQLSYAKFDAWGHQLVPETMLSDSVAVCSYPKIGLFGMDSLWAVWMNTGDYENEPHCQKIRALTIDGQPIGPTRCWTDSVWRGPLGYAFQILPDRSVVLAFSDAQPIIKTILMIHERPDGTRILDHVPIFRDTTNGEATDRVAGYVDTTRDTLQIMWREVYLNVWQAVYAKRAAIFFPPIDSTHLGDHVALTPPTPGHERHPGEAIKPLGDSLFIWTETRPTEFCLDDSYIHLLRWNDYSEISSTWIGCANYHAWDIEPDGRSVSAASIGDRDLNNSDLHFRRFSLPDLGQIEDTLLAQNRHGLNIDYSLAYAVSPGGARHLVFERTLAPQYNTRQLYYRFWRSDLAVASEPRTTDRDAATYTITPNPTSGHFTIAGPLATATSMTLYNIMGQQVGREFRGTDLQTRALSYSTNDLPVGVYFLHIATPVGMTIQKVMVVK
jgi:hypothetical protein